MLRKISHSSGVSYQQMEDELQKRKKILTWMKDHNIIDFQEVSKYINLYYKDSGVLMDWVNKDADPEKSDRKNKKKDKLRESASGLKMMD